MWTRRLASTAAAGQAVGARRLTTGGAAAGSSATSAEQLRCLGLGFGVAATAAATALAAAVVSVPAGCDEAPAEDDDLNFGLLTEEDTKEEMATPKQYENWTNSVKALTNLPTFGGMKLDLSKQITPNFVAVHRVQMGGGPQPGMPDYYQFGAQVFDETLVAIAQVDKTGMVEGQFICPALPKPYHEFGGKLITIFFPDKKNDMYWLDLAVAKETFTSQLRLANNHQMVPGYMLGLAYTQSITPRLSLGGETTVNVSSMQSTSAACTKYDTPDWTATGTWKSEPDRQSGQNQTSLLAQYHRKVVPGRINLGTELELSPSTLSSQVMFGAEFQLKQSKVSTSVDGSGKICSVVESKIDQNTMISLSAELQFGGGPPDQAGQPSDHARFGFGFQIAQ